MLPASLTTSANIYMTIITLWIKKKKMMESNSEILFIHFFARTWFAWVEIKFFLFCLFRRVIVIIKNLFLPGLVIIISTASWFRTASDASHFFPPFSCLLFSFLLRIGELSVERKCFHARGNSPDDAIRTSAQFIFFPVFLFSLLVCFFLGLRFLTISQVDGC